MTDMPESEPPPRLPDAQSADGRPIRSEEELRISTRRRAAQRARLVRHLETETRTVRVRHEQVRVEFEPIADGELDPVSPAPTTPAGEERWLTLYDEEITVQRRWIPRERVRLGVKTVVEDWEITEAVRSERIDADVDVDGR